MIKNQKGQISVYMVLSLLAIMILALFSLEVVRIQMGASKGRMAMSMVTDGILAEYQPALFERYHLMFLDASLGNRGEGFLEEQVCAMLSDTLNPVEPISGKVSGLYGFDVEDVKITGQKNIFYNDYQKMKEQIHLYMKYRAGTMAVESLAEYIEQHDLDNRDEEATDKPIGDASKEERDEKEEKEEKTEDAEDVKENENYEKEEKQWGDIKAVLAEASKIDLVDLTCPLAHKPSPASQDIKSLSSYQYVPAEEENLFYWTEDVGILEKFSENRWNKVEYSNVLLSHAETLGYMRDCFSSYTSQEIIADETKQHAFGLELEYLLCGKDNDKANLTGVLQKIVTMRFPMNLAVLLSDSKRMREVDSFATNVCILTCTEELQEAVKYVLTAAWAYLETIVDIRTLLKGEKVPIYKTAKEWKTDLLDASAYQTQDSGTESGITYEEYLLLLLALELSVHEDRVYDRMIQVTELNLRIQTPELKASQWISDVVIESRVRLRPKFSGMIPETGGKDPYVFYYRVQQGYQTK